MTTTLVVRFNKQTVLAVISGLVMLFGLAACQKEPPTTRPPVALPVYDQGDAVLGKVAYEKQCKQCHSLQVGSNNKGPQLLRIYGANVGLLNEYQYTDALKNSQIVWTAESLDRYIANPKQAVNGTRMRSEPIADAKMRQDIIAYLSTLK
ncbi:class I cytochrome c [Moraxella macacae 0408225]|uniref:Class I cytochrome c n=1 Tax=Moraxella macacae 0408225 TaxID=1230338 RepID=L2FA57_9GAMM|nr:c-type cytochrome [Moraxella macacae]ELA09626.1 class I cytochrome c [Moraxella macacae 0408225]